MQMRRLGTSGLHVPELSLGTMAWGTSTDVHEAGALLREYLDAGGNLVDSAAWHGSPAAQEILGTLMESTVARDELLLSVSGGWRRDTAGSRYDTSRRGLLDGLDATLARLGTDHVDLFVVAGPDPSTPWSETVTALETALRSGRTHYVGLSGVAAWQAVRAGTLLETRDFGLDAVSAELSLLARSAEREHTASNTELGAGLLAWAPLGRGVLSGKYRRTIPADSRAADPDLAGYVDPLLGDRSARIVEAAVTAAQGLGLSPVQLAHAWVLSRPGVSSAVVGARTLAQLRETLREDIPELPRAVLEALDEVSVDEASPQQP